ncbi:MAG: hypothetical protein WKF84_23520 [Pyrinomonadaceae bacterium]
MEGKVVWVTYVFRNDSIRPLEMLSGDVLWHPIRREAFVVIMKANNVYANLGVYRADLNKQVGRYPLELDPQKYREWPGTAQPISQIRIELSQREVLCGLDRLQVSTDSEYLQIRAERADNPCATVDIRFNLETKQWSEVSLQKTKRR